MKYRQNQYRFREVFIMNYKYKSYGISDIMGKDPDILGESNDIVEPKEKFIQSILKNIATNHIVALTPQNKKDLLTVKMIEPDNIIMEGLLKKEKKPYRMYLMKNYTINKLPIEMCTNMDYEEAEADLETEISELKRAFTLVEPRLFNSLFVQQADFHMNCKNVDELKSKCKLDQVYYMPESERNFSYCRFAYNYDNIHGQINQKFFNGMATFISIWLKNGNFYSYQFSMARRYRSDEFTN